MPRKGIKSRHKHKPKNKPDQHKAWSPVLILAVPVLYLVVILLGAVNQLAN